MSAPHTPGPWEADQFGGYIWASPVGDGRMIAEIRGWGWLQKNGEDAAVAEQEANSRLIAAAPELLAALRSACENYLSQNGSKPPAEWLLAVAKAEGRV